MIYYRQFIEDTVKLNVQIARQMVGGILEKISMIHHIINLPKYGQNQLRRINEYSLYYQSF